MNKEREEHTMIDEKALSIMADIMDGVEQTDEWKDIQMGDPGIEAAEGRWSRALESAKPYLPRHTVMLQSCMVCGWRRLSRR